MIHLWNLFDKIVYITKICSSPAQTLKLVWDIIAVEKYTIYSFKLNQEETIISCLQGERLKIIITIMLKGNLCKT